jgi:hypothetical protein
LHKRLHTRPTAPPAPRPGPALRTAKRAGAAARLGALLLGTLVLAAGCAVGLNFPQGPEGPPGEVPAAFAAPPVYAQICALTENSPPAPWLEQFILVMQRDYGVLVLQSRPAPGEAHVQLRITLGRPRFTSGLAYASAAIATATLSIIPGYFGEDYFVQFAYAVRVPGFPAPARKLDYRYGYRYALWLPFIVYPDFIAGIGGGYENPETKHRPWEQVARRFAAALRTAVANPADAPGEPYDAPLDAPCPKSDQ